MPARLTAHVPDRPACLRLVGDDDALSIGRDPACSFLVEHPSVSRLHARLAGVPGGWMLEDAGSKNGCFVDGERIGARRLDGNCWLRFGDVYCEFEPITSEQAEAMEQRIHVRRQDSAALQRQVSAVRGFDAMLAETLRAAVELAGCERGFLLLGEPGALAVRNAIGLAAAELAASEFSGSVGAVRKAMDERRAVVANDVAALPWLGRRASVVAGGIRALVCAPITAGAAFQGEVIGAVYADRVQGAARITELDLELFTAFVERMSLAIAARRAGEDLGLVSADALRWQQLVRPTGAEA